MHAPFIDKAVRDVSVGKNRVVVRKRFTHLPKFTALHASLLAEHHHRANSSA